MPRTSLDEQPHGCHPAAAARFCSHEARVVTETGAAALETASLGHNTAPHLTSDDRAEAKPSLGPRVAHAHPNRKKEVGPARGFAGRRGRGRPTSRFSEALEEGRRPGRWALPRRRIDHSSDGRRRPADHPSEEHQQDLVESVLPGDGRGNHKDRRPSDATPDAVRGIAVHPTWPKKGMAV